MRYCVLKNSIVTSLILFLTLLLSSIGSAAQIKLAWDPNIESDLAGYKVYYGTASGTYGTPINVGNVTTCTLTGLTNGQMYFIAVTAYNTSDRESGYSNEVSGTANDSETVGTPNVLSGPTSGTTGTSYTYSTGGSTSNLGHSVQYQFDWKGDGTVLSAWGSATQSETWTSGGTYNVRARARCSTHTTVVSNWSSSLLVAISAAPQSYTVTTNPSGLQITVDDANYTAPKTFSWTPGASHKLSVSSPQNGTSGTRYVYSSWSDSGGQTHTITVPSSGTTYRANFTTQYSLTTSANPSTGGTVSPSGTNWYNSAQSVSVSATANTGYTFSNWFGDLSGSTNPTSIGMNGPKNVAANFTQIPGAASLISPSGAILTGIPRYTWNAVAGATWYQLKVSDSTGNKIQQWYAAAAAGCPDGTGTCSVTPTTEVIGSCQWWIQTYNSAGFGPWSAPLSFTTPIPTPPVAATQVSPTGSISDATPTYTWNAVSNATWYCLYVNDVTGNKINQWYTAAQANCPLGTGNCTVTPTTDVRGAGKWWVRTYNSVGYGPWSSGMSFTAPTPLAPSAATQVSPTGTISDTTPTYTWKPVANATWYCLYVNDSTGNKINQWYAAADAGCADGVGTCSVTPTTEVRGSSQWWVQTYNSGGLGPWSLPGMLFKAPTPFAPSAATQVSPTGTITDTTPAYTWNPVANATWYQLWVGDSTGNRINQWYPAADVGCADGVGTCSVTPTTMVLGPMIWYIQTYNSGGYGPWSLPGMSFTVSP